MTYDPLYFHIPFIGRLAGFRICRTCCVGQLREQLDSLVLRGDVVGFVRGGVVRFEFGTFFLAPCHYALRLLVGSVAVACAPIFSATKIIVLASSRGSLSFVSDGRFVVLPLLDLHR